MEGIIIIALGTMIGFILGWLVDSKKVKKSIGILLILLTIVIEVLVFCRPAYSAEKQREYPYKLQIIGKVVAFEVGWCCKECQFSVASACANRCEFWYGGNVIDMVTDGNDEYYMMNPDYVWLDEANGFNFWEHYEPIMDIVWKAFKAPEKIYFWDNADTQGEWAEFVKYCEEDNVWFWK